MGQNESVEVLENVTLETETDVLSDETTTEEIQVNANFESVIQDVGSAVIAGSLFGDFLICGCIVAIKMFGGKMK